MAATAWYREGTLAVTSGSKAVTGTGTSWLSQILPADLLFMADANGNLTAGPYEVETITSDTALTIKAVFPGASASGAKYFIVRHFNNTLPADLSSRLSRLIASYQVTVDQIVTLLTSSSQVTITGLDGNSYTVPGLLGFANQVPNHNAADDAHGMSATGRAILRGDAADGRSALGLANHQTLTVTSGGAVTGGGAFTSKGANLVNEASAIKLSQEAPSGSYLTAYGADAGTQGSLTVVLKSSNGSASTIPAVFSSTGVAITGALSVTDAATTRSNLGLVNHEKLSVFVDAVNGQVTLVGGSSGNITLGQFANGAYLGNSGTGAAAPFRFGINSGVEAGRISENRNWLLGLTTDNGIDRLQVGGGGYFAGNLGVGVAPSAWISAFKAVQISTGASIYGTASVSYAAVGTNHYYDGAYTRIGTGYATLFESDSGSHRWYSSPSGAAGSAINWSLMMTLGASGNLGVGTSAPAYKLVVSNAGAEGIEFAPGYLGNQNLIQHYNRQAGSYASVTVDALSHKFNVSGSTALTITSAGRIIVNTTDDGASVAQFGGGIRATGKSNVGGLQIDPGWNDAKWVTDAPLSFGTAYTQDLNFITSNTVRSKITGSGLHLFGSVTNDGSSIAQFGGKVSIRPSGDNYGRLELTPSGGDNSDAVISFTTTSPRNGGNLVLNADAAVTGGAVSLASSGVKKLTANAAGVSVFGTFSSTGGVTVPDCANDSAAAAAGVPINAIYRTGTTLKVRAA